MTNDKLLRIYLNDHLAASKGGLELCKRALSNNEGTPFSKPLERLASEIEEERRELVGLLDRVGGNPDAVKQGAAWVAEKAGRIKLNGQLTGYSPLSRLVEIEGLAVGIEAKLSMWRALRRLADVDPRIPSQVLEGLIESGERQRDDMEKCRLEAADIAFALAGESETGPK